MCFNNNQNNKSDDDCSTDDGISKVEVSFSIVDKLIDLAEKHDRRGHSMICMFLWQIVGVLSSGGSSSSNSSRSKSSNNVYKF